MRTERCRERCAVCRRRTMHKLKYGRLRGEGPEASRRIDHACQVCGRRTTSESFPNLLASFFSVAARR